MKLLIIRHGQSEADLLDVHEGRADFPLTALGHRGHGHPCLGWGARHPPHSVRQRYRPSAFTSGGHI